ncbi:MAG: DUF1707 domain-containing protein [Corynebacterium sp.]|uniref:DUF1707 SHOCT-like domain-containing protein n=1 Tax=Corynebacterium sp. TaxID=1720 RepID=UPI0026E01AD2|nr:DUF1707 domain-containing protein [Corynebacterium sp.]MDO5670981.1 DUF1707 domain-containing protein [Corynebacterium sp.]
MNTPDPFRIRASDDDRQRAAAALSQAFSQGQLDYREFDERTQLIWSTKYREELLTPLEDLFPDPAAVLDQRTPAVRPDYSPEPRPHQPPARSQVTGESGGDAFSVAIMGGSERAGNWLCSPTHTSLAIMGGTGVDLREARLGAQETVINAIAVMGGIEIIVPEDVRVVSDGIGIMGGFGISDDESVTLRREDIPADAPVIRFRGIALMGGVGVTRKARGAK